MEITTQIYNDRRNWFLNERAKDLKTNSCKIDIIQIGDSITEGWNISRYTVTDKTILNSGIGGDITDLLLKRLERDCLNYQPENIFLMIGINDIRTYFTNEQFIKRDALEVLIKEVSENIIKIIEMCSAYQLTWFEILPINEFKHNSYQINQVINTVNQIVIQTIKEFKQVNIIKFNELITYDGRFDANQTYDGLHPNDDAYYRMTKKINYLL